MFSKDEVDTVLEDAQQAVDALAEDVGGLNEPKAPPAQENAPTAPQERAASAAPKDVAPTDAPEPSRRPPAHLQRILKLKVPLLVRLAERPMPVGEILKLAPGMILEFDRTVDCELDLMVNNCPIGRGIAVKIGEHFGLRISHIGDLKQRVDSLHSN